MVGLSTSQYRIPLITGYSGIARDLQLLEITINYVAVQK